MQPTTATETTEEATKQKCSVNRTMAIDFCYKSANKNVKWLRSAYFGNTSMLNKPMKLRALKVKHKIVPGVAVVIAWGP